MIHMTLDCGRRTQSSVIEIIQRNVGLQSQVISKQININIFR